MMVNLKRSVAGLALGATAFAGGALVAGPMVGWAQEDQPPDESAPENDDAQPPDGPCGRGRHLEAAAEAIGIEADALREALQGGQTMAQVAEANGVEVQAVVDALSPTGPSASTRPSPTVASPRRRPTRRRPTSRSASPHW